MPHGGSHDAKKVIPGFHLSCGAGQNITSACHADSSVNTDTMDTHMVFSQISQFYRTEVMYLTLITVEFILPQCVFMLSEYHKIRKWSKHCQVFSSACIPRNTQPEGKHSIFTNILALAFRMRAIYTHVP